MDTPQTPKAKSRMQTCPEAPWCPRHQAHRHIDDKWAWPREIVELSKQDIDAMPNDIKRCIYSYLRKTIKWD